MTLGKILSSLDFPPSTHHSKTYNILLYSSSVNCRLPQTPRTPAVAMGHYFDETLHRGPRGAHTPKSPATPRFRRSSTARSLAARSDFDGLSDDEGAATHSRRGSSVVLADPERLRRKAEADEHMHNYVAEQLERVRSARDRENGDGDGNAEEFEAHV